MSKFEPTSNDAPSPRPRSGASPRIANNFEQQWLRDYLSGDESGFTSLYHRYRGAVYRYFLAHHSVEASNRLYLQTWTNFLAHITELSDETPVGAAVFAEAHHLLLEGYRERDKSLILSFADGVIETVGLSSANTAVEHPDMVNIRLGELPPAWRETLLVYLETGFDGNTLGYALHVNSETAHSRLKRAFAAWRKLWPEANDTVDGSMGNAQPWVMRYRTQMSVEPAEYLDTRVLRQADWNTRWLPQLGRRLTRYWHIALTAIVTGVGVFGYLWTMTAPPQFRLEVPQPPPPPPVIASTVAAKVTSHPLATASAPAASAASASLTAAGAASAAVASATETIASTPTASASPPVVKRVTIPLPPKTPAKPKKAPKIASAAAASQATASAVISSSASTAPATTPAATPEDELNKIRWAIRNGRVDASQRLLKRFQERYPDYPIPLDLQ